MIKEVRFFVEGMHCASCEILIEKRLLEIPGIKSVEASAGSNEVLIEYEGEKPRAQKLNRLFQENHYLFSEREAKIADMDKETGGANSNDWLLISVVVAFLLVGFLWLKNSGLTSLINLSASSSLPMFFAFGLLAGVSTCAALVGGMVLSLSKKWGQEKFTPHLLFNTGRLLSFAIFGAVLGLVGSKLQLSLTFSSVLVMLVSMLMILLGLQMLGIRAVQGLQVSLPKAMTRFMASENNFQGKYLPLLLGAGTFFLPCGFTLTVQGLALLSGSPLQGSLMMTVFVLGTLPSLLLIGFSSYKLYQNHAISLRFTKIAGVLVLFFALYNLNAQMNLLGLPSFTDLTTNSVQGQTVEINDLPAIVNGQQIIKMNASSQGYDPNYFKVRVGVPVRWEITDTGTSGCTNAVISRSLFEGDIKLTPGQTSVKEFTPTTLGKYKFSCWMGMVNGMMEVVDSKGQGGSSATQAQAQASKTDEVIGSGAKGCGCGGQK